MIGTLHGSSFDILIHAFYVAILNLSLCCSIFDYDTSWNYFDFDIHWKYFCLWDFLVVLWIVIRACNTFIVVFSDSTLDMSVILSGSPFVLTLPGSTTPLKILLIVVLPGSICLDSPFNFVLLIEMLPCSGLYCNTP